MLDALLEEAGPPPALPLYASGYYEAFRALQHDRAVATRTVTVAGPQGAPFTQSILVERPIAFAAIDRYARRYGIEGDAFARLVRIIRKMDDVYRGALDDEHGDGGESVGADDGG